MSASKIFSNIAVIGAGTMGSGIAAQIAQYKNRTLNWSQAAGERESREERDRSDATSPGVLCRCSSMKCEKSVEPSFDVAQRLSHTNAEAIQQS